MKNIISNILPITFSVLVLALVAYVCASMITTEEIQTNEYILIKSASDTKLTRADGAEFTEEDYNIINSHPSTNWGLNIDIALLRQGEYSFTLTSRKNMLGGNALGSRFHDLKIKRIAQN